jgi:hypothetical protein
LRIFVWISAVLLLSASCWAHADSFTVESIEVEGIKKITIGTVGFFDDIELLRRDNVLLIKVVERPSIAEVNFEGNNDIEDEALEQALDGVNMSKGRIFDQNKLEKLELELQQVYYSLGKYAARIDADWRKLDEDRVAIDITISEGVSAKIKSINITGNQSFEEKELLDSEYFRHVRQRRVLQHQAHGGSGIPEIVLSRSRLYPVSGHIAAGHDQSRPQGYKSRLYPVSGRIAAGHDQSRPQGYKHQYQYKRGHAVQGR